MVIAKNSFFNRHPFAVLLILAEDAADLISGKFLGTHRKTHHGSVDLSMAYDEDFPGP